MKLGPVTKLNKRNKTTSKRFDDDDLKIGQKIVTSLSFLQFMTNLEQSRSWIPVCKMYSSQNVQFAKRIFSLELTFYLTKNENNIKKSLPKLSRHCFE